MTQSGAPQSQPTRHCGMHLVSALPVDLVSLSALITHCLEAASPSCHDYCSTLRVKSKVAAVLQEWLLRVDHTCHSSSLEVSGRKGTPSHWASQCLTTVCIKSLTSFKGSSWDL